MPSPIQGQNLKNLIQKSSLLQKEQEYWLKTLPRLSGKQFKEVEKIFRADQETVLEIEQNYQKKMQKLGGDYYYKLYQFKRTKIPKIQRLIEGKERKKEIKKLLKNWGE